MNEVAKKMTPGYLSLMLGLGVNPIARRNENHRYQAESTQTIVKEVSFTTGLVCRWDENGHMHWSKK